MLQPFSQDAHLADTSDGNTLVESHLYLVQHIVNELATGYPRHIDRGELWSAGAFGLVEASRRYDPSTGVPFASFARLRIRGAIIDSARTRDWASRRLRRELRDVSQQTAWYEEAHGRAPGAVEIAEALEVPVEEVTRRQAAAAHSTLLHLDVQIGEGGDGALTLGDTVLDADPTASPEESLEQNELDGTLRTAISLLPDVQREVVERTFFEGALLRHVAESLGVTEARVSQIRAEALAAVKAYFATAFEGVEEVPTTAPGTRQRAAYVAAVTSQSTWRSRLDGTPIAPRSSAAPGL